MRIGKPSPALVISIIALLFAMTGTGIAAKSLITGKQIKDGSITAKDLANGAVTQKKLGKGAVATGNLAPKAVTSGVLAPNAVTDQALAPNAVTSASLAAEAVTGKAIKPGAVTERSIGLEPRICPNGVVVFAQPCPTLPLAVATAENLDIPYYIPALGAYTMGEAGANIPFKSDSPGRVTSVYSFDENNPTEFPIVGFGEPGARRPTTVWANALISASAGSIIVIGAGIRRANGDLETVPGTPWTAVGIGGGNDTPIGFRVSAPLALGDAVRFSIMVKTTEQPKIKYMRAAVDPNMITP